MLMYIILQVSNITSNDIMTIVYDNFGGGVYVNSSSLNLNGSVVKDNQGNNFFDTVDQMSCSCVNCGDCGNIAGCLLDGDSCACYAQSPCGNKIRELSFKILSQYWNTVLQCKERRVYLRL
jgi:hypothetical protein